MNWKRNMLAFIVGIFVAALGDFYKASFSRTMVTSLLAGVILGITFQAIDSLEENKK